MLSHQLIFLGFCFMSHVVKYYSFGIPFIFVYTLVPKACRLGVPNHLTSVFHQAHTSYRNGSVVLITNFRNCSSLISKTQFYKSVDSIPYIQIIDIDDIISKRTITFYNSSRQFFKSHHDPEYKPGLWIASTLRFLLLEDFMTKFKVTSLIHFETDIMIYGDWKSEVLPLFQFHYKFLAATRLSRVFYTASIFWVSNLLSLHHFTSYLEDLVTPSSQLWTDYLNYLRIIPNLNKLHGIGSDSSGKNGLKPGFVCEMSMLVYYSDRYRGRLLSLPIIPQQYTINDKKFNKSDYAVGGRMVGGGSSDGIFDPGSWGQYLGGTGTGAPPGFTDASHYIGTILKWHGCDIRMACDKKTNKTMPFVRCLGDDSKTSKWTRLFNLHVHSKKTNAFESQLCSFNLTHL